MASTYQSHCSVRSVPSKFELMPAFAHSSDVAARSAPRRVLVLKSGLEPSQPERTTECRTTHNPLQERQSVPRLSTARPAAQIGVCASFDSEFCKQALPVASVLGKLPAKCVCILDISRFCYSRPSVSIFWNFGSGLKLLLKPTTVPSWFAELEHDSGS